MFDPATINKEARHLSMNLGQSVAVCLYELIRQGFEGSKEIPTTNEPPATAEDRERLTQLLLDVMHVTEYTRRFPANAQEPLVRQPNPIPRPHSQRSRNLDGHPPPNPLALPPKTVKPCSRRARRSLHSTLYPLHSPLTRVPTP